MRQCQEQNMIYSYYPSFYFAVAKVKAFSAA